ncbi:hypothetical protein RHMOL_Rhmol02G0230400 [Rhododendron molle]|uniref:Uncharacterized protein n=1 Tax=Rhododendron molle TaxID=49168 RepID=A0ACC0PTA8_RHOML|nr:hypothetical protein RHMOL_Rhmol02G0230400 [Rhododendron molle]
MASSTCSSLGDFFNFKLVRSLVDNADHSIFGAIYEFKSPPLYGHHYNPRQSPPRYVVALRGTMTKWETMPRDLTLDVKVIRNTLKPDPRFQLAMQAVRDTVSIAGAANMWLAGHSLGSAMALLAGKNMAEVGFYLETYLFSPPFIAVPIEMTTKTEILEHGARVTRSVMTAGVVIALDGLHLRPHTGDWAMLSRWIPYLFVNPSDPISTGYVGYFEQREWMAEIGAAAAAIERIATRNTISGACLPLHLLPSAYLTTHASPGQDFRHSHGLEQWWRPNIQCQSKLHQYFRNNPHHRRSVAASLVQGVYSLEHDRLEKRQWHQALAPLWGDFFNFKLIRSLVDNVNHSIFGAIYEFKSPPPYGHRYNPRQCPPRYVVALRGTMTKWEAMSRDLTLDVKVIRNTLERSPRFQLAMQAVHETVSRAGAENMWLAGHSLGSAMALLAGKNMAKMGFYLETYLFNPPFIAVPIEMMTKTQILKHGVGVTRSVMTAVVATALDGLHQRPCMGDWFAMLSGWVPNLFVNPFDPISTGYVGYFEHREWMAEIGAAAAAIERIAARNTISGACQPLHLLPSANLTTNASPRLDFRHAHGLEQWWRPNIQCQSKLHQYFR